jgi:hypothetical protein
LRLDWADQPYREGEPSGCGGCKVETKLGLLEGGGKDKRIRVVVGCSWRAW